MSIEEFNEIQMRNKNVCSSAIARAVQDASAGLCAFYLLFIATSCYFESLALFYLLFITCLKGKLL